MTGNRPESITVRELITALEAFEDDAPVYLADCGYRSHFRHAIDNADDDVTSAEIAGDDSSDDPTDPDAPPPVYIKVGRQIDYLPGAIRDHFRS